MTVTVSAARAKQVDAMCRARAGLPYAYGGAFTTNPKVSTDCSGLVMQTAAWLQGRNDWSGNRYGSTESFRGNYKIVSDLGFKRLPSGGVKALSFQPIMLAGFMHGGGGVYSHTSCTLFFADRPGGEIKESKRGIDWESRGGNPGVFYYDGARAWNDPLYHDFWYLDAKLASAPVVNEIDAAYARAKSWLGARKSGELKTAAGDGVYSEFENGRIYFKVGVGTHYPVGERAIPVPRHIVESYDKYGSSAGPLGFPVLRHTTIPGAGDIQAFERGTIYRKFGEPGFVVRGMIRDRFAKAGYENGWGWPTSNEVASFGGQVQTFEKESAFWHPSGVYAAPNK